jgi:hypothetical protein
MIWRGSLRLKPAVRAAYEALHDALAAEVENDRLEDQARRVPGPHVETSDLCGELSKTERKYQRRRDYAQTGAVD